MGRPGRKLGDGGTRWRVLACLSDAEWRATRQVADRVAISLELAYYHLRSVERAGLALQRGRHGSMEWCWLPDGNTSDNLDIGGLEAVI